MESPAEKRMRKCGTVRRKRTDPRLRPHKIKRKLGPEAQGLMVKLDEIRDMEEKLRLVDAMRRQRNQPMAELDRRIEALQNQLNLAMVQRAELPVVDLSDLDDREQIIRNAIDRLKGEAADMMARAQAPAPTPQEVVDGSPPAP